MIYWTNADEHVAGKTRDGRRLWKCSQCGRIAAWSDRWEWCGYTFGGDPMLVFIACCDVCAQKLCKRQGDCDGCQCSREEHRVER